MSNPEFVLFSRMNENAVQPSKAYPRDAGWDLHTSATTTIAPHTRVDVPTGIEAALPYAFWGHILPRSSTLRKHGLQVVTAVIDSGYRGEMFVQVYNPTNESVTVEAGTRLAQLILHRVEKIQWVECPPGELPPGERGNSGFGSSGV